MNTVTIPKTEYRNLVRRQEQLSLRVNRIARKLEALSFLQEFERLTKWGRQFAKEEGIRPQDVLKND